MRRAALVLLALGAGGCEWLTGNFTLRGVVDLSPELASRAPKQNSTLFVVAQNAGGVPLAMSRIVNPEFPAPFAMRTQDLLVPEIRSDEALTVIALLNGHGNVDKPQPGDVTGKAGAAARPGDRGVRVLLDRIR